MVRKHTVMGESEENIHVRTSLLILVIGGSNAESERALHNLEVQKKKIKIRKYDSEKQKPDK